MTPPITREAAPKGVKPAENAKELKGTFDGATLTMVTKPTNAKINTEMKYGVDYTTGKEPMTMISRS